MLEGERGREREEKREGGREGVKEGRKEGEIVNTQGKEPSYFEWECKLI